MVLEDNDDSIDNGFADDDVPVHSDEMEENGLRANDAADCTDYDDSVYDGHAYCGLGV